jgi:hypothetical protein
MYIYIYICVCVFHIHMQHVTKMEQGFTKLQQYSTMLREKREAMVHSSERADNAREKGGEEMKSDTSRSRCTLLVIYSWHTCSLHKSVN